MIKNYFKTAVRNLVKTKGFSLINILGLSVGTAACLLLLYYVSFEKSYDSFHTKADRIVRVRYDRASEDGSIAQFSSCSPPVGALVRDNYPEIENVVRIFKSQTSFSVGDLKFFEDRVYYSDPDIVDVFDFKFLSGNPKEDLVQPNQAFISQSMAKKYFGDADPVGKVLSMDKTTDILVKGVFADIPQNSHIKFDFLLPMQNIIDSYGPDYMEAWGHTGMYTYFLLKENADREALKAKLATLVDEQVPWLKEYKMTIELPMQPLRDIHLTSNYMQEYEVNGNAQSVRYILITAFFIIIMAWVNYINLSTARAMNRANEVGLRKVIGATRTQLINQFFMETILINLAGILLAIILILAFMPLFQQLATIPAAYNIFTFGWFWLAILSAFVAGVLLSGLYPVLVLSSFEPMKVIKGKLGHTPHGFNLRKALIIFQFAIALVLITTTLTVFKQISYMRSQNLGFSVDQTLVIKAPRVKGDDYEAQLETFKTELKTNPAISKFCVCTEVPGKQLYWDAGGIQKASEDDTKSKNYQIMGVDYDFMDVYDIEFIVGESFSEKLGTNEESLILNETAVNWMGWESPEAAYGQQVSYWGQLYTIIGVIKDYHQQGLQKAYEPTIYRYMPIGRGRLALFNLKVDSQNMQQTISAVKEKYDAFFPGNPFHYFFLDDYFDQQYRADERFGRVFTLFSYLAVFITILGIYGLSAFNAVQRTKEIGIRKVLGADVRKITTLLVKDFFVFIGLSFIITLPLLIFGLNKWLENYAFRMNLSPALFVVPIVLVGLVTMATVGFQTIKAAVANPINSLRYE